MIFLKKEYLYSLSINDVFQCLNVLVYVRIACCFLNKCSIIVPSWAKIIIPQTNIYKKFHANTTNQIEVSDFWPIITSVLCHLWCPYN